ncbi:hypothetical protein BLOT_003665, partial [Blomia tropicalis]
LCLFGSRYALKKLFQINLNVKSYLSETINVSCPQLGINIKIEHFSLSSKLFNSKYNSLIVLKFSDIRLEGDIAAAIKCFMKIRQNKDSIRTYSSDGLATLPSFQFIIQRTISVVKRIVSPLANYFCSNFQISLHNTSLMQLGLPTDKSIFNECLLHSTIQLIQIGFTNKTRQQLTFQVDGFSIKVLKSNNQPGNDGKSCLAQMSFPILINYLFENKFIDMSILDFEIILYDILQLLNILLPIRSKRIDVEKFSKYKFLERILLLFPQILQKRWIREISFRLNTGSIKLVREFGKKELTFGVAPIDLRLNKLDSTRLEAYICIENFKIQDSESIIDFSLCKCLSRGKIEQLSDKLYFQQCLEINSTSCIINSSMINSWFQYFIILFKNVKTKQVNASNELMANVTFHEFISIYVTKFIFSVDINDISLTMKQLEENSMVTYGLKHLKTGCVHNLDQFFKETSIDLVLETFWCWNGNKNLKPSNPNSLKKYNEKHVPLFMSNLLLKFGNMSSSDLRINCVMDGLQVSAEYFLNQFENVNFDLLKNELAVNSSSINSDVSGYNILAQINFTSVNLFTSQLMVRIDSMAIDLNGRKLTCSTNGFAINSMYAPSATLACLKASELIQHRIVYFSVMRINFSQDHKEITLSLTEEIFVQWSPLFHLNVIELYEDFYRILSNIQLIKSGDEKKTEKYNNRFKGYNMNLKLDGKINIGILLTNESDTMRFETEYFLFSLHNMSNISSKCELLSIYFNDVHNCKIENLVIRYLNEVNNPLDRKSFKLTEKDKNDAIEIIINKVALYFPYQFNFAYYFNEKLLSIIKWLRNFYSKDKTAKYMQNESNKSLTKDFIIKIQNILIEVWDDPFEVRLIDNYGLIEDEYKESQKRWNKLMEKIEETRRKAVIIPESRINELKSSFDKQNAQTYIKRSRKMYDSNQIRKQLFTIKAENFQLQLISDTAYNTYDKMVHILKTIDCYSPFPDDLKFSTIWCKQLFCNIGLCIISLRDFPQPMLNAKVIYLKGVLLGAEQEASARARRTCDIDMGPNFAKVKLERSMTTLKYYHDISSKIGSLIYTHGACWEPILQQVNLSFENIFKPSYDPSPSLTWWDKMRFLFHGNLNIISDQISIVLHVSLDPYNSTELIQISFLGANIQLVTGKICVSSDLDVYVHTASKYDECRIIHLPDINITFILNWECCGNKNDHHSVMPCARDKLPEYTCNQVHDSYRAFRSHHLNLLASIETKELQANFDGKSGNVPSILLYNSTLRWLENKMFMITGFPRLTRRGKLYNNTRPRKMPFTRLFKSIRLTVYLQKLEITYWSSFNRNRGFKISSLNLTQSAEHRQTFVKINDNLIHRPKPVWELIYMNSELSCVEIDLYKSQDVSDDLNELDDRPSNFFINVHKVSYNRETKVPHIVTEEEEEQSFIHRLIVHDLKGAWTKDNRDIVLSLFDSYFKTQLLKRNLSTEALRLFKDQINNTATKNQSQSLDKKGAYGETQLSKGNAAHMLQQLISDTDNNIVDTEQIEDVVNDRPLLYGMEACQGNDILLNNWLIELINSQVVLRGCETDGYVIVSAAKSQVSQRIHRPVWRNRVLHSKMTWQGSLECMQYYATVDAGGLRIDDITWLDIDDIQEQNGKEIAEYADLVGSGRSVGGVVNSEAGGSSCTELSKDKVPIQLQRIVSRCRCQFFYANYGENTDPNNYEDVPPLPQADELLILEPLDRAVAVDTFTLTHEHLEISTNSQQFAMIMDLVNNLLLYVEPHKKEVFEKQQRIRFSMQLNTLEDQRQPISELQDKVRLLLSKIKLLEKESYQLYKNVHSQYPIEHDRNRFETIELQLAKAKDELSMVSEDLSIMINCYKEAQLIAMKTKERQVAAQESREFTAQVIRRNEVCFKQASWRLTDSDGQLGLADLVLNNFLYTKVSKNDDSVEHSFELGYVRVQNMLPNQVYRDVLQPTELQPNMPVDQHRALRILCIEKAPVGGISVKEHLEVNVIPLTVGLTHAFFKKMLKFFFPERGSETTNVADSNVTDVSEDSVSHSSFKPNKKKAILKKDESLNSLTSSLSSYNFQSNSKNPASFQHIEKMRERASKNQTFVFIKIPEVPIRISYKGNKNKNLEDLHDVNLMLPTVEYHNRTWTWLDLLMSLKNDSKRVLLSQALKHKFHISKSSKPVANESDKKQSTVKSSENEEKVRILLGDIVVPQKTTKSKSILLFGNKK